MVIENTWFRTHYVVVGKCGIGSQIRVFSDLCIVES